MPLYGHELTETISPLAGGQQWAVKFYEAGASSGRRRSPNRLAADATPVSPASC